MRHYTTFGEWSYQELRPFLGLNAHDKLLKTPNHGEFKVKMSGPRLNCFKVSPACAACGIVGVKFLLQIQSKNAHHVVPHLNLYAIKGEELVLMTKEHIMPWCLGERRNKRDDDPNNLETRCLSCNMQKGAGLPIWIGGGRL